MDKHVHLPTAPTAAREARAAVHAALSEWNLRECLDDALLVVSELATNAVRYGAAPIVLRLVRIDGTVRIAVQDGNSVEGPQPQSPGQTEPSGRGLHLIAALSNRWGWDATADGKTVWAEVGRRSTDFEPG